jgi:transcription factor YY
LSIAIIEAKMASIVGSEVEIQDGEIVEVESIPVEMNIETVETVGDADTIEVQPMIALQPLPEAAHEEIVSLREEVVGGDPHLVYTETIPVPAPSEIEISTEDILTTKRGKGGKKKGKSRNIVIHDYEDINSPAAGLALDTSSTPKKWEQKQVQIKTLEGEFSVTMWASGELKILGNVIYMFVSSFHGFASQNAMVLSLLFSVFLTRNGFSKFSV